MDIIALIHISGLLAILGALIYAVGDVLLLASEANLADYPNLQPHAKLLSGSEKMVVLSWKRLVWGGLLGVFATPLVLAGFWQVFLGLSPSGMSSALPPTLLFVCASVVGAFVHGSFIYLGEYVQALNQLEGEAQTAMLSALKHQRTIMLVTYGFVIASILIASIWFGVVVALGGTAFPIWMAVINPVTATLAWLVIKRILPKVVRAYTEGAGFNIAYLAFFIFTTVTLW